MSKVQKQHEFIDTNRQQKKNGPLRTEVVVEMIIYFAKEERMVVLRKFNSDARQDFMQNYA